MEIKACPFCGTNTRVSVVNVGSHFTKEYFAVYCDNCGATGPVEPIGSNYKLLRVNRQSEAKNIAVEYWNDRKQ